MISIGKPPTKYSGKQGNSYITFDEEDKQKRKSNHDVVLVTTFLFDNPIEAIQKHTQGRKQEPIFMNTTAPEKKGGHQKNRDKQ